MKKNLSLFAISILAYFLLTSASCINNAAVKTDRPLLEQIKLPPGFKIEIYAEGVDNARSMAWGEKGTLFIGTRNKGKVYAVVDKDGDLKAEMVYTIATNLKMPNGVAFKDGSLYVAEVSKIWRFDKIEDNLETPPEPVLVSDEFPNDQWHGWKYIAFGPDGKLYVPVGAPCNICLSEKEIYASITRMNPDGSDLEVFVHGVRNSVGFGWHPETGNLWFTDNGRDFLGDDSPNDELNEVTEAGQHFGYPYCHAGEIADPKFGEKRPCSDFTPPAQKLNPHGAALGLTFYTGDMFPAKYKDYIFIAEHGSWNRSTPIGYQLSMVKLENGKAVSFEPFATGWLGEDGKAWGRPVDVLQMADGSLLVSDDHADVIYRISTK